MGICTVIDIDRLAQFRNQFDNDTISRWIGINPVDGTFSKKQFKKFAFLGDALLTYKYYEIVSLLIRDRPFLQLMFEERLSSGLQAEYAKAMKLENLIERFFNNGIGEKNLSDCFEAFMWGVSQFVRISFTEDTMFDDISYLFKEILYKDFFQKYEPNNETNKYLHLEGDSFLKLWLAEHALANGRSVKFATENLTSVRNQLVPHSRELDSCGRIDMEFEKPYYYSTYLLGYFLRDTGEDSAKAFLDRHIII